MRNLLIVSLILAAMTILTPAQNAADFRVYDAQGTAAEIKTIVDALDKTDVVFLGEQHDDPTAHVLQAAILQAAFEKYGKSRQIILSMEMFERDSQIVLDEYLADLINENNFVQQSRAWGNYKTDYRPLVEFAKANKIPVVAANAPRRYVNRIARLGKDSLKDVSPDARKWFAPLDYSAPSAKYAEKFNALMGKMGAHSSNILESQNLWDATMANSIAKKLKKNALVIHLNGAFHTENRLGTVEHLQKYKRKARIIVVTMKSNENFPNFDKSGDENAGDFVILTNPKLPRSQR